MTPSDLVQLRVSAAEVLGCRCVKIPEYGGHDFQWYNEKDDMIDAPPNCPEVSDDALRLCEALRDMGYDVVINLWANGQWECRVFKNLVPVSAMAATAPLAITLAALRAMGKGEEK